MYLSWFTVKLVQVTKVFATIDFLKLFQKILKLLNRYQENMLLHHLQILNHLKMSVFKLNWFWYSMQKDHIPFLYNINHRIIGFQTISPIVTIIFQSFPNVLIIL